MKQRISASEWKVMEVLWNKSHLLAVDIIDKLNNLSWSDRTVKTLISRLVDKGAIGYNKEGKSYRYYPILKKDECIKRESRAFIKNFFNGSKKEFIASFIKNEDLTDNDIKELREILDRIGDK